METAVTDKRNDNGEFCKKLCKNPFFHVSQQKLKKTICNHYHHIYEVSSFRALYGDFEYLGVFIDNHIAHITMVCCCSNKICDHSSKVKT